MAQDEVILDGDAQLDLQLDGAVGLLTLIEAGIAQIIFNDDYTITFILADGREFTTGSIRGAVGAKGDKGDTGAQGIQGEKGDTGPQGPKGDKGDTGETGPKGDQGDDYILTQQDKADIAGLVNASVSVSGTTPSITGLAGVRYVCGECATLSIVAPESGCIDVTFTSGSAATLLTVTSAKSGVTAIKWANGFDPTSLDADTTYEINILDGEYGVVGKWT